MALVPNFSVSQISGAIKTMTITDTSTGSDAGLTLRLIYIKKADGTYLVPPGTTTSYIVWPIASASLNVADLLDKDYAAEITVKWFTGSTVTYTKIILTLFTAYSELFLRQLTQYQAANPDLIKNNNFWGNKSKLRTLVDDAKQGVTLLNDQTIATYCLNAAKQLTDNPSLFF